MEGNRVSLEDSNQRRQNSHMLSILKSSAQCTVGITGSRTQPKPLHPQTGDSSFSLQSTYLFVFVRVSWLSFESISPSNYLSPVLHVNLCQFLLPPDELLSELLSMLFILTVLFIHISQSSIKTPLTTKNLKGAYPICLN